MKPCWPVYTFKNCLQHDSGLYTGDTFAIPSAVFSCFERKTRDQSQRVPLYGLGGSIFLECISSNLDSRFNRWLDSGFQPAYRAPLPLREKSEWGSGCAHRLPDFKEQGSGFHKPAKIFWIRKSGLPYTEAITFISQPCLFSIRNIVVNLPKGCPPKALKNLL